MSAALLGLLLLSAGPALLPRGDAEAAEHVAVRITVAGRILDHEIVDIDGDGRLDLILAVRPTDALAGRRRALHLHLQRPDGGIPDVPDRVVPILDDVVAWGAANVRDEPGAELILLTRSGAWSYSTALDGYRGNVARLAETPLLFDMPSPGELPRWRYVLPRGGLDAVLLPGRVSFSLWMPGGEDGGYVLTRDFVDGDEPTASYHSSDSSARLSRGRVRIDLGGDDQDLFLDDSVSVFSNMLSTDDDYRSPALADVDGDGEQDLLLLQDDALSVHFSRDGQPALEPDRVEQLPEYLKNENNRRMALVDIDRDGDVDMLVSDTRNRGGDEGDSGLGTSPHTVLVLLNDGKRLFPETPDQVLQFDASHIDVRLVDVDQDGRLDLIVTKFEVPDLAQLITGFELRRALLLYLADDERPFSRKPVLRDEARFDLDTVEDAIVRRLASHDLSGDGLVDVVEVDLSGHASVRRILRESSFFGGDSWELEARPWNLFRMPGTLSDLSIVDINEDGLGDLLSAHDDELVLQLSRRATDR